MFKTAQHIAKTGDCTRIPLCRDCFLSYRCKGIRPREAAVDWLVFRARSGWVFVGILILVIILY